MKEEIRISGDVASRLRRAAEQYGFDPEGFVDYLLTVLLATAPVTQSKVHGQDDYTEVLERLKKLGYT